MSDAPQPPYGQGPPGIPPPPGGYGGPPPGQYPPQPGGPAPYQQPPMAPPTGGSNGMAVAALVMGILTFFCLGPIGAILAIVFGFLGLKKANEIAVGKGMSIAGIVLGIVGLVGSVLLLILIIVAGSTSSTRLENIGGRADPSNYSLTPGTCNVDDIGIGTFEGTITNRTSSSKNFEIKGEFRDKSDNTIVSSSSTLVSDIGPGDTARWHITTASTEEGSQVSCSVTEVDNFLN